MEMDLVSILKEINPESTLARFTTNLGMKIPHVSVMAKLKKAQTVNAEWVNTFWEVVNMLWVIHLTETDGDVVLWPCASREQLEWYINEYKLHMNDYAVIEGDRLKDFHHNTIQYNNPKRSK